MAQDSVKYKWITVQGTNCIVWLYHTECDGLSKSGKRARKKEKDELGLNYPEVPMLDTMLNKNVRVYCYIIMVTHKLDLWEAVIRKQFLSHQQVTRKISGGEHIVFTRSDNNEPFISVNFYHGTTKIMVQPGLRQEENLLEWLKHFPAMKALVTRDQAGDKESSDLIDSGWKTFDNPQAMGGDNSLDLHTDRGSRPGNVLPSVENTSNIQVGGLAKQLECKSVKTNAISKPDNCTTMYVSCVTDVNNTSSPVSDSSDLEMMSVASHASDSSETKLKQVHSPLPSVTSLQVTSHLKVGLNIVHE